MDAIFADRKLRPFLAIFCAGGWSLAYPLIKLGYAEFGIGSSDTGSKILFAAIRFMCAGLIVNLICGLRRKRLNIKSKTDYRWLVLLAVINTALHYMFAYIGLGYNTGSRSTILDSLGGFILIILSAIIFKDDRMNPNKIIGCIAALTGIVIMNLRPGATMLEEITFMGDGMILLNVFCAAFGGIITRIVSKKMNMMPATGLSMTMGGAMLLLVCLVIRPDSAWNLSAKGAVVLSALILISALCFAVYNELLAHHPISSVAIYNALIPVLGVIFSSLILGEKLIWQYFLAVFTVTLAIVLVNRNKYSRSKP